MKRAKWAVLVMLVCAPMAASLLLLLAVTWPRMDSLTMKMPQGIRSTVASGILNMHPRDDAEKKRATQLNPRAVEDWAERLPWRTAHTTKPAYATNPGGAFPDQQSMYAHQKQDKARAHDLELRASSVMDQGDACGAEKLYAEANSLDYGAEVYRPLDGLGQAATRCGHLTRAREALEEVTRKEDSFLEGTPEDALMDMRNARATDLQFLSIVYDRQHETVLKDSVCHRINAQWSSCKCELTAQGAGCSQRR